MGRRIGIGLLHGVYWVVILSLCFLLGVGKLAGIESCVVQSGSMAPSIPVGAVVVINKNADYAQVEEGDVIVFSKGDTRVTHRAIAISEEGIETKGDANENTDGITTTETNFVGKVVFSIPKLGFLLEGNRKLLLVGCVFLLYLVLLLLTGKKEALASQET
jgi:signal peptidase